MDAERCLFQQDNSVRPDMEEMVGSVNDPPPSRVYLVLQQHEDDIFGHMVWDVALFFRY